MKAVLAAAVALLLQFASVSSNDPVAEPQHFRYERSITLPHNAAGQACVVLDAAVFAHAATGNLNDLRLYTDSTNAAPVETPFNFSISGTQDSEDDSAPVRNRGMSHGDIVFDLEMPSRPYSAVELNLAARDFLGTTRVSAPGASGGAPVDLGTFAVFDLTSQHLSRSTTLPLQEASFPKLHIELHLTPAPGSAAHALDPAMVQAATVPPSREAQTLYTPVASTGTFQRAGSRTVATIHVPAHVPVERISFTLDPKFLLNFLRTVTVTATPDNNRDPAGVETVVSRISRVHLPQDRETAEPAIDSGEQSIDAAFGADFRTGATVRVVIDNGGEAPLPLRSVQLEMRQRKICFDAAAPAYLLMYGDAALRAPVYDYARRFVPSANAIAATLGPDRRNRNFTPRRDDRPYTERHPELLWIVLLAVLGALGSVALRGARRRGRR